MRYNRRTQKEKRENSEKLWKSVNNEFGENLNKRREKDKVGKNFYGNKRKGTTESKDSLKVVTNEKGEASGAVLTIRCYVSGGGGAGWFCCHFNGLPSCMNSY